MLDNIIFLFLFYHDFNYFLIILLTYSIISVIIMFLMIAIIIMYSIDNLLLNLNCFYCYIIQFFIVISV